LDGLLLVAAGQSCRQVGLLFGENPTTMQRWVSRFDESGLEGLRELERSGRPRPLQSAQWRKLKGNCVGRRELAMLVDLCCEPKGTAR